MLMQQSTKPIFVRETSPTRKVGWNAAAQAIAQNGGVGVTARFTGASTTLAPGAARCASA